MQNTAGSNPYLKAVIGAAVLLVCLIGSYFLAPNLKPVEPYMVAQGEVSFIKANDQLRIRRPVVGEQVNPFSGQWQIPRNSALQFNYVFETKEDPQDLGMYFPSIGGSAKLYINGVNVAGSEATNYSAPGLGNQYIFTRIKNSFFQPGLNRVNITLEKNRSRSGLKRFYFGPHSKLKPAFKRQQKTERWQNNILLLSGLVLIVGSILSAFNKNVRWLHVRTCLLIGFMGLLFFLQGYLHENSNLENFPLIFFGLKLLALLWLLKTRFSAVWEGNGRESNDIEAGLLAFALFAVLAGIFPLVNPSLNPHFWAASIANLGLLPLFLYLMGQNIVSGVKENKREVMNLKLVLREKERVLAAKEAQLQSQLKRSAVLEERERITRDIHDGIGGLLLSLLVRVRSGRLSIPEIEADLQEGINDLRLVVDSMDENNNNLITALATFRMRAKALLDTADIVLHWQQEGDIHTSVTGPRAVLDVYRLLQEAVSNTVRHSEAKNLSIKLLQDTPTSPLIIKIADDGVGFCQNNKKTDAGKGLRNMKNRAARLGAELIFEKGINGSGFGIKLILIN